MAQVFISYSRQDRDFVVTLQTALTAASRDVWVDLQDIPPTAAWLHEIYAGIEGADAFVYVLSPDSVASEGCTQELEYALRNSKRIVPLVYREVDASKVIEPVRALNWIFFRPSDDFGAAFAKLTTALDTDLDYWHQSAQYLVRARLWEAKHENTSFVLRGTDLAEADQWLSLGVAKQPAPTPLHVRYITTSRRVAQRQQRRTISFLSGVSVLLAALAVAALIFSNEARIQSALATQERDTAVFHQLLAESAGNLDTHPDLALLDGLEATKYRNTTDSRTALFTALERYSYLDAVLQDAYAQNTEFGITDLTFSADGHTLLSVAPLSAANTSDQQTLMTVWDVQTRQPRLHFLVPGRADFSSGNVVLSPNGRLVAVGFVNGQSPSDENVVDLYDATTGVRLGRLSRNFINFDIPQGLAFSPNGSLLASYECGGTSPATCLPAHVTLWNVATRTKVKQLSLDGLGYAVALAFSPDGASLAVNECLDPYCTTTQFRLWNVATGTAGFTYPQIVMTNLGAFAFSANGRTLAIGGCADADCTAGETKLVDVATGQPLAAPFLDSNGPIEQVALGPDGQTLVTIAGTSPTLRYWYVTPRTSTVLSEHPSSPQSLALSSDGTHLASGGGDDQLRLWRTTPFTSASLTPSRYLDGDAEAVFSPDGKKIASANCVGQLSLWDTATGKRLTTLPGQALRQSQCPSGQFSLAFSSDGKRVAVAARATGGVWVRELATGRSTVIDTFVGTTMMFSPDGHFLVTNGITNDFAHGIIFSGVTVWDVTTGAKIHATPSSNPNASAAFSPDGSLLAIGGSGTDIMLVNGHDFSPVASLHTPATSGAYSAQLAFSPDGMTLAALDSTGAITLWNLRTHAVLGTIESFASPSNLFDLQHASLAFSRDGQVLAASLGHQWGLWEVATHEPVIAAQSQGDVLFNLTFSPDGRLLLETGPLGEDGPILARYATLPQWQAQACAIANRNLTRDEWSHFFSAEPYHKICLDLPAI